MNSFEIKETLSQMGYKQNIVTILDNGYKLSISGSVHVQEIKDKFDVMKWEYSGNKVLFTLGK